jgi:hypothetical protein
MQKNHIAWDLRLTKKGMQHVYTSVVLEPLLCNDREVSGYTRVVSGQWLGKRVPKATIEELCFLCGPCRDVISKGQD